MNSQARGPARIIGTVVFVIVLVALFAWRFQVLGVTHSVASIRSIHEEEGKPIEVVSVRRDNLTNHAILAGTVEGIEQYSLVSNNRLRVDKVVHSAGDMVEAGDPIILLEKTASSPMQHSYNKYLALYEDAERDSERMAVLFAEGAVSAQALDKAKMQLQVARTNLNDAKEATDLHAPLAGQVMSVLVNAGETVKPGSPLAWIARTDTVKVVFQAGSRQALSLNVDQPAIWRSPVAGDILSGSIDRLDLAANPKTHLLEGDALFHNLNGLLLPGILVSIEVETGNRQNVLTIPVGAMEKTADGYAVYVLVEDGSGGKVVRFQEIQIGMQTSDLIEVTAGLTENEQVVVFGKSDLKDGDLVQVIDMRGEG